ncbi:MAG: DUF4960 domain-containing protein [Muribaculaceae bacterium]|nr:DUF4960 domain-containing protein [Muribaculaceae bacterium]
MKFSKLIYMAAGLMLMTAAACSEYTPDGYTEAPDLPTVSSITYQIGGEAGHDINISWTLPADKDVTGCILYRDAREVQTFELNPQRQYTYTALGTPLGEEVVYTVKVIYENGYISTGKSVAVTLPVEELAPVSNLKKEESGRRITLSWTLPTQKYLTGIRIVTNGDTEKGILLPADATSYVLKSQPMETELQYSVEAVYDTYYYSPAQTVSTTIPYIAPKMLYLLPADAATVADLSDDDEKAAAEWFAKQPNAVFIHPADIPNYDPAEYSVMWIDIDRVDLPMGWENLPGDIAAPATIAALKNYSANGGNLYLSDMAVQLTVPLGFVPDNMAPTVFSSGMGGENPDTWAINPNLGWDFRNGADQGYYERIDHDVFKGLAIDTSLYDYPSIPLIGPGYKEDHNCIWDCNLYGRGSYADVIRNFEVTTNSLVLATWGHVRDHCVAGLVDFLSGPEHGRCVANGFSAYEWNQNDGKNIYQENTEKLTENILNYLK